MPLKRVVAWGQGLSFLYDEVISMDTNMGLRFYVGFGVQLLLFGVGWRMKSAALSGVFGLL